MSENSNYIFRYLGTAWDFLPKSEKDFFGKLWKTYEKVIASSLQKNNEADLNISLSKCLPYTQERWQKFNFDKKTQIISQSEYKISINPKEKLDLTEKYLIGLKINNIEHIINCSGLNKSSTEYTELVYIINKKIGSNVASIENNNNEYFLSLKSVHTDISFFETTHSCLNNIFKIEKLPFIFNEYPYKYELKNDIHSIPNMQDKIIYNKKSKILKENIDYIITRGFISFKKHPPESLWAKKVLISDSTPYYNFGWLINLLERGRNPEDYLLILQGIWAAYWTGPKPSTIKSSLSLLLGLPIAKYDSLIVKVTENLITTLNPENGKTDSFIIPNGLHSTVRVGQYIKKFTPLTNGIEVSDSTNYPNFLKEKVSRSSLKRFIKKDYSKITEDEWQEIYQILTANTFLPQIDLQAFSFSKLSLSEINQFLMNIKSKNIMYFPEQLLSGEFNEKISYIDKKELSINISPQKFIDNLNSFDSDDLYMDQDTIMFLDKAEFITNIKVD